MTQTDQNTSRVTMLGTGNAMCVNCYNTCFYLKSPKGGMLVDGGGGNGILQQLIKAKIPFEHIRHMFVTHSHTDHIMGAIWMMRKISPMIFKGKHKGTLTIYCNDEVKEALYTMGKLMIPDKIFNSIGQTIFLQEVHDGEQVEIDDMQVTFFDIGSTRFKQYGFSAQLPDGQRLVCLGDEPYSVHSEPYARGCDWLMCEAFCLYKDRFAFNPYEKNHSTALDAGMLAQELGVKNLVLYHTEDTHLDTRAATYSAEAAQYYKGRVFVPNDLESLDLIR
ncbi:MAG: MBL fold metallo-hydrolase [Muribaculaceae bacterium]|jgi:ribonuclease Z|nr:MBL fold metallo-hydrolase [Muribaculaceae bacterium]MBQ7205138.1 MBL fold metallo-hydrolase [Muribaculaceae bacterium]